MSKILLLNKNKETVVGIGLLLILISAFLVQTIVLVTTLVRIYQPVVKIENKELIDAQTVNEALQFLNE